MAEPLSRRGSSASAAPGTTVSTGRTFPTGVGAPILLEGLHVLGRVRPSSVTHRSQALLLDVRGPASPTWGRAAKVMQWVMALIPRNCSCPVCGGVALVVPGQPTVCGE